MVQRVAYGAFHGVREAQLLVTAGRVVGHATRGPHARRAFRDWLKDQSLWDKEHTPDALDLLDVPLDASVSAGPWAQSFFAAEDDEATRDALFARLTQQNTLLVKYVLEALDVDAGGRLHSTHELHRMLSSYVYPGEPIKLVPFQHWIAWMVASGRIKLIGIRWGLTPEGKAAVPRLRMVDPDEFLEDEEAEREAGHASPPDAAPTPAAAVPAAAAPAAAAPAAAVPAAAVSAGAAAPPPPATAVAAPDAPASEPDDAPDLPPEAAPVDDATFARYEAALGVGPEDAAEDTVDTAPAEPAVPPPRARPRPAPAPLPAPQAGGEHPLFDALLGDGQPGSARALELLAAFAADHRLATEPWLARHGVAASLAEAEPTAHLFVVALLARLHVVDRSGALATELLDRAGGPGPIAALVGGGDALGELVVRWGLARHGATENALRAALFDAVLGGRTLGAQPDLPARLMDAPRPEALIASLLQGVLRAAPPEAPFWLVRAYVRAGLWTHDAATRVAAVPWEDVRLLAYRLGLLASHYCRGTSEWIAVAEALSSVAPAEGPHVWALEAVAPGMALTFDPRMVRWG